MRSTIAIVSVLAASLLGSLLLGHLYQALTSAYEQTSSLNEYEYSWFFRLLLNLVGYSTVLLPCFLLYKYLERTHYFDNITNPTCLSRVLYACFGSWERLPDAKPRDPPDTATRNTAELAFCATGLMGAYLVWGLLQEKIMTQSYVVDGRALRFSDSQLLVFVNRLAALCAGGALLAWRRRPAAGAPLYRFSYCALTNIVSAWCQYEALKYVSFPTQVLSKSCKVLPVMAMGRLVSRAKYAPYEYLTAALISAGMVLFMMGSRDAAAASAATTGSGLALLALYMGCDSFTSSWQAALFAAHDCSALQMLCGVNLCSCLLSAASLLRDHAPHTLLLLQQPAWLADVALLSASSALGQLLIYRTIAGFGAVVFTIIMTLRQAVSILVSCAVFGHAVSAGGAAGVLLVLGAVLLRLYCADRRRRRPPRTRAAPAAPAGV